MNFKSAIEDKLTSEKRAHETVVNLKKLVDHLSTETCREITNLIELDEAIGKVIISGDHERLQLIKKKRTELHFTLLKALDKLESVYRELSRDWTPAAEEAPNLDGLVNELEEHAEWMEKGNARVMSSLNGNETTTTSPAALST